MQILFSIIMALVTLGVLVTIHEFGHYWVARRCGVRVLRFAIGFGRTLYSWQGRDGTEFALCAIPLGGYVKMLDERDGEAFVTEANRFESFNAQPVRNKLAIVAAGPAANFLLAIMVLFGLFVRGETGLAPVIEAVAVNSVAEESGLVVGQEVIAVDGQATSTVSGVRFALLKRLGDSGHIDLTVGNALSDVGQRYSIPIVSWLGEAEAPDPAAALGLSLGFPPIRPEVGSLSEGGAAARADFRVGDVIIEAAGMPMAQWTDWVEFVRARPNQRFDVLIDRAGNQVTLSVMPQNRNAVGTVGMGVALPEIPDSRIRRQSRGPIEALGAAVNRTYELTVFTFESMWKMVQGLISTKKLVRSNRYRANCCQYGRERIYHLALVSCITVYFTRRHKFIAHTCA